MGTRKLAYRKIRLHKIRLYGTPLSYINARKMKYMLCDPGLFSNSVWQRGLAMWYLLVDDYT